MEFIANAIGNFFLTAAFALSAAALGIMTFATVVTGLTMALASGKVMEMAKDWFWRIAGCAVFSGAATLIVANIQSKFAGGA